VQKIIDALGDAMWYAIFGSIQKLFEPLFRTWCAGIYNGIYDQFTTAMTNADGNIQNGLTPLGGAVGIINAVSETVFTPIAVLILTAVICWEIISMVVESNNMHEFDVGFFIKVFIKAGLGVLVLSHASDIVQGIFETGNILATQVRGAAMAGITFPVQNTAHNFKNFEANELVPLILLGLLLKLFIAVTSIIVFVIILNRMLELAIMIAVAPLPLATAANRAWGDVSKNFVKNLIALALQGAIIILILGIMGALIMGNLDFTDVYTMSNAGDIDRVGIMYTRIFATMGWIVVLDIMMIKSSSIAKTICGAH